MNNRTRDVVCTLSYLLWSGLVYFVLGCSGYSEHQLGSRSLQITVLYGGACRCVCKTRIRGDCLVLIVTVRGLGFFDETLKNLLFKCRFLRGSYANMSRMKREFSRMRNLNAMNDLCS